MKDGISLENFLMKSEQNKESFTGIYDFNNSEIITGKRDYIWKDVTNNIWLCKGIYLILKLKIFYQFFHILKDEIKDRKVLEECSMKCKKLNEHFFGVFDFKNNKRGRGKGFINQEGKEYFVEYNEKGKEYSRKRTFEGIRLMIIGNK